MTPAMSFGMGARVRAVGAGLLVGAAIASLPLVACLTPPPLVHREVGAAPDTPDVVLRVVGVAVRGFDGREHPLDAIPRRPRIEITTSVPLTGTPPIYLFGGALDDELLDDLRTSPLRSANVERAIPAETTFDGAVVRLTPLAPLPPGPLVVTVAAWAERERMRLGEPFTADLRVGEAAELGAQASLAWPADGAVDVGVDLPSVMVAFDGDLGSLEGIDLQGPDGAIAVVRDVVDCAAFGLAGTCVRLAPMAPLRPLSTHTVIVDGAHDATGAPLPLFRSSFRTASGPDLEAPVLLDTPCFVDERALGQACVLTTGSEVALRVTASEPVRGALASRWGAMAALAPRGALSLLLARSGVERTLEATLSIDDVAARSLVLALAIDLPSGLPRVVITEVRADPLGREPSQEYVELFHAGDAPLDLAALSIADDLGEEGDALPSVVLSPGARVLVVADTFDPDAPPDPPVPAGVPLVRIGTSIGDGGLSAAGEPVVLRFHDDDGAHRISEVPARAVDAGQCLQRVDGGFVAGACSPGS